MHCYILIFAVIAYSVTANPAVEQKFKWIVNSNDCLKECMRPVQNSNLELSVFKRSNYSDYFLKIDQICTLVKNGRHCLENCNLKDNPFALISMNAICSDRSRQEIKMLEPCFANVGEQVQGQCADVCGDYEEMNDKLRLMTSTYKPNDQDGLQVVNQQTNNACAVNKCSARCSADNYNRQCGHLPNGKFAGDMLRDIVERILTTHRTDLQVFGLLEKMKQETQPECNYLHTADVLFNPINDKNTQQALHTIVEPQQPETTTRNPEQQLKLTANRLYVAMLKKQLRVLDKQLELMNKQERKLDNEMPFQPAPRLYSNNMF